MPDWWLLASRKLVCASNSQEAFMNYFVHERSLCESLSIGAGTRIWAFAHVLPGAGIGAAATSATVFSLRTMWSLATTSTVKCGMQLWDGVTLEDEVFIGPNVTFTNDIRPRSKIYLETFLRTTVEKGASIGANATILPGLRIGRNAMIGAGAVVTRSVPPNAIVVGNPAKIIDYTDTDEAPMGSARTDVTEGIRRASVQDVRLYSLKTPVNLSGYVSGGEFEWEFPFVPRGCFMAHDASAAETLSGDMGGSCQ
jgi:serine acetyltransferase